MVGLLGEFTEDVIHRARASESDSDADSDGAASKRALLAKQRTLEEVLRTLGARATRLEDDARRADKEARAARHALEDARRENAARERDVGALEEARDAADGAARAAASERDDVKAKLARAERDLARVREERNALRKDLEAKAKAWRDMEEEHRRRERAASDDAASARAESAKKDVELESLRRRCESAEAYANSVNARVTEAEREIDAFNEVVVSSGDGLSRELREQLARAEETRVALENELARVTANAIAQEGELKKLRVMVEHDAPGVAELRARVDAMDVRERDLVSALRYEETKKDEAIREMYRARAAAAKAEAHASRLSAKSSHSQALATVIESLGDSLFD